MSYEKQNFTAGQVLKAEHLNHMEEYFSKCPQAYSEEAVVEILPSIVMKADEEGMMLISKQINVIAGETYTVKWNGTEYTCTARAVEGVPYYILGDAAAAGLEGVESTGEPFVVLCMTELVDGMYGAAMSLEGLAYASLSIFGKSEVVEPIDDKYINSLWLPKTKKVESERYRTTFTPTDTSGYFLNYRHMTYFNLELWAFIKAKIIFDGVEYIASPTVSYYNGNPNWMLVPEGYSTENAPFLLSGTFGSTGDYGGVYTQTNEQHTMIIYIIAEEIITMPEEFMPESVEGVVVRSSTEGSTKLFKITVDDTGAIKATEVTT